MAYVLTVPITLIPRALPHRFLPTFLFHDLIVAQAHRPVLSGVEMAYGLLVCLALLDRLDPQVAPDQQAVPALRDPLDPPDLQGLLVQPLFAHGSTFKELAQSQFAQHST
jgi:hypothetical protein